MEISYDDRHGGPFDRGGADSYYRRPERPHYYVGGTGTSRKIPEGSMTPDEILAYRAGYAANEAAQNFVDCE